MLVVTPPGIGLKLLLTALRPFRSVSSRASCEHKRKKHSSQSLERELQTEQHNPILSIQSSEPTSPVRSESSWVCKLSHLNYEGIWLRWREAKTSQTTPLLQIEAGKSMNPGPRPQPQSWQSLAIRPSVSSHGDLGLLAGLKLAIQTSSFALRCHFRHFLPRGYQGLGLGVEYQCYRTCGHNVACWVGICYGLALRNWLQDSSRRSLGVREVRGLSKK